MLGKKLWGFNQKYFQLEWKWRGARKKLFDMTCFEQKTFVQELRSVRWRQNFILLLSVWHRSGFEIEIQIQFETFKLHFSFDYVADVHQLCEWLG